MDHNQRRISILLEYLQLEYLQSHAPNNTWYIILGTRFGEHWTTIRIWVWLPPSGTPQTMSALSSVFELEGREHGGGGRRLGLRLGGGRGGGRQLTQCLSVG
jgi:hypothetical protein